MSRPSLVGIVAVGTVFVEGRPGTPQAFTEVEREVVFSSVMRGQQLLQRLSQQFSPNRFLQCSFFHDWQTAVIAPGPIPAPTDTRGDDAKRALEILDIEPRWLKPAMAAIGFPSTPGLADPVFRYQEALKLKAWRMPHRPRHAVVVFVTKFNTGAPAYWEPGHVTIQFDWISDSSGNFRGTGVSGHGVDSLDRTVAHEIGHEFGGLDEYERCKPAETSGPLQTPNRNCMGPAPCLMRHNSPTLCSASVEHFGWVDVDGDGVVDAALPVISVPATGLSGDVIEIVGEGLGETRSVVFTGVGAADFTILDDQRLQVTVPAGGPGGVDVFVTTPFGPSRPGPRAIFTYQ